MVPDLAVEILSPSNTSTDITRKIRDYFKAGSTLVWVAYPETREVYVYTSPKDVRILDGEDSLDGGTLLPGFLLSLRDLFGAPDESR
jgi:Uma2 family endonuclease